MFTQRNVDAYGRILLRVFSDEEPSIRKQIEELEEHVDDPTITISLEPINWAARHIINRIQKKSGKEIHRFPANWEIRRFLKSSEYQRCTNHEAREAIYEVILKHSQNIKRVPPQNYLKHHREDVELLFEKLVVLNADEEIVLKKSLDRQFSNEELEGVFRNKGLFDSFSGTYAFSFNLPLNDHPINFHLALRELVSDYLPETDERLLWRPPLCESLWSETKNEVEKLVNKHTRKRTRRSM